MDSSVAAVLLHKAIGDRFHAVMVDNGCLRKDESAKVIKRLREKVGINLQVIDASDRFLDQLTGVTDPEQKRKIIGKLFIDIFARELMIQGVCIANFASTKNKTKNSKSGKIFSASLPTQPCLLKTTSTGTVHVTSIPKSLREVF